MRVHLIGDTHGKAMKASGYPDGSIQLGDFNLGGYETWEPEEGRRLAFIDGNHDDFTSIDKNGGDPQEIQPGLFYIPRAWVCGHVMFLGGAESIDYRQRQKGHDIFFEESISQADFWKATSHNGRIEVMLTHTCPDFVGKKVFHGLKQDMPSDKALTSLWEHFKPNLWVFGHFHKMFDEVIEGTRFICLPECQGMVFNLPLEGWPDILSGKSDRSLPE